MELGLAGNCFSRHSATSIFEFFFKIFHFPNYQETDGKLNHLLIKKMENSNESLKENNFWELTATEQQNSACKQNFVMQ